MSKLLLALTAATTVLAVHLPAAAGGASPASTPVLHRTIKVDGTEIFYREAGRPEAPVIVLLHGFPSSSHMFRNLIPRLSGHFRVIAPDYPGFGHSATPSPAAYNYNFDNLARTVDRFLADLGATRYVLYLQDYGGPVGLRVATAHPERVAGLVIQNANAYLDGFGENAEGPLKALWKKGRSPETEAPARELYSLNGIRLQYVTGARDPQTVSPDSWTMDHALLATADRDDVQLRLLEDYKTNLALYPSWQAYFRQHRPKTLVTWGKNDPIFTAPGALAYGRDLPEAEIVLLDTGHFALEEEAEAIGNLIVKTFATEP
jgi:pimeloyl-ACP methyl ester carboxylesterase